MFENLNSRRTVRKDIDTTNMEFKNLKDFCGETIKPDGFFFNDSKYGKQVVLVGSGYLINMPTRAVKQFEKIEENSEMLEAFLSGHCMIENIRMIDTRNGATVAFEFADI